MTARYPREVPMVRDRDGDLELVEPNWYWPGWVIVRSVEFGQFTHACVDRLEPINRAGRELLAALKAEAGI